MGVQFNYLPFLSIAGVKVWKVAYNEDLKQSTVSRQVEGAKVHALVVVLVTGMHTYSFV